MSCLHQTSSVYTTTLNQRILEILEKQTLKVLEFTDLEAHTLSANPVSNCAAVWSLNLREFDLESPWKVLEFDI